MGKSIGLVLLLVCSSACDNNKPNWYRDIKPITDAYCTACHVEGGIGPFSLTSYADFRVLEPAIRAAITERKMPPFYAERNDTLLRFNSSLTDDQVTLINAWYESGAERGDVADEGEPIQLDRGGLDSHDIEIEMATDYTPTVGPDEYRCFVFDWPGTEPTYVTGAEVIPGNNNIAHHAAIYIASPDFAARTEQFDEMEPGPGYSCFGGAESSKWTPTDITETYIYGYLAGWVPGASAVQFKTGTLIQPGSKLILQMHYFIDGRKGEADRTRLRIQTKDQVEKRAFHLPWMNLLWPLGAMPIPPNKTVTYTYTADPLNSAQLGIFADGEDFSKGMVLHSTLLHMHTLGKEISLSLERADGSKQMLVRVPNYDFAWQREYVFKEPISVVPGDKLTVSCTFENTESRNALANRGRPEERNWGEGTLDEMCVAHTRISH